MRRPSCGLRPRSCSRSAASARRPPEAIAAWEKTIDLAAELKRIAEFGCHIVTQSRRGIPGVAAADLRPAHRALRQRRAEPEGQELGRHGRLAHDHALRARRRRASWPTNSPTWASPSSAAARAASTPPPIRARSAARAAPSPCSAPASTWCSRRRTRSCSSDRRQRGGDHPVPLQPPGRQAVLPHPQPHRRRHDPGHGGGRGQPDQRRAHHRQLRHRIRPAGLRRARAASIRRAAKAATT